MLEQHCPHHTAAMQGGSQWDDVGCSVALEGHWVDIFPPIPFSVLFSRLEFSYRLGESMSNFSLIV